MDFLWQIDLLGGLRARGESRTIDRFRTHKSAALLAYLAYHLNRAHARDELAELLWPGSETAAGRLNLRVELASLRRQLEPPSASFAGPGTVLRATHAAVSLNPGTVITDVASFEAVLRVPTPGEDPARRIDRLQRGSALYRGELLPGFFEEWVLPARLRLADRYLAALRELSCLLQAAGNLEGAIDAAHRAVAADRLSEEAHFDLIRLYAAAHRPDDAFCQYQELEEILREKFGEEPGPEIRRFVADLAARGVTLTAPVSGPRSGVPITPAAAPHPASRPEALHPPEEIPPPRLPLTLTRFFGRDAELAHLDLLLLGETAPDAGCGAANSGWPADPGPIQNPKSRIQNRLVTLTGPAGSGKTRLAIEAAHRLSCSFAGRVWFVPLADLIDPAAIPDALTAAMRLPRSPDVGPIEQLVVLLGRRPCLLVLDNMEQLLEGGRQLVRELLERVPGLACLVTSRQRLHLEGEREIPVLPLPVPGVQAFRRSGIQAFGTDNDEAAFDSVGPERLNAWTPERLNALVACPSIALLVDRAQAARPDFQLTARNAAAVAALCARLDGLPLAIELAAAWAQLLTPAQMLARVGERSALLVSRRKDRPVRHQSVQAAIEWSYHLLDPDVQRFFARLAVFRGSWDIEAAEAICGFAGVGGQESGVSHGSGSSVGLTPDPQPLTPEALSLIAALRDRSLVVPELCGDVMRYRLLESVREYARERLSEEEWQALVGCHTAYYRSLAEQAEPHLRGARQREWAERLQVEEPNLQAALERSEGSEEGLRLAAALPDFRQCQGQLHAGRDWLERQLSTCSEASPDVRAKAAFAASALAYLGGDPAGAERLCQEGLRHGLLLSSAALAAALQPLATPHLGMSLSLREYPWLFEALIRGREDPRVQAFLLATEGKGAWVRGDYAAAAALAEQSLALYQELGDRRGIAILLWLRGSVARYQGDDEAARRCGEESLLAYQELGDQTGVCALTGELGYLAFRNAEYERAERLAEEALALSRRMGRRDAIAGTLWLLGRILSCRGRYEQAAALLQDSLEIRRAIGAPLALADTLIALGLIAHARADYPRARALLQEALDLRRQDIDQLDVADALYCLGLVALTEGRHPEAESLLRESLELGRQMQNDRMAGQSLRGLGLLACRQGDLMLAEERLRESMALLSRTPDRKSKAEGLEALAELWARQEQTEEAIRLYAAAAALREAIGAPLPPCDQPRYTRYLASLSVALGPDRFAAVWEAARSSDADELLALAEGVAVAPLAAERAVR